MARPHLYSAQALNEYLDQCARSGQEFWCALWHDHATGSYDGRCHRCQAPVAITEEAMERTFWRRIGVPRNAEPKVKCDRCGTKLHVVPNKQLLDEMLECADPRMREGLKHEREDKRHRDYIVGSAQPSSRGEDMLVQLWDLLTENYGDLPAPVQMWLEEHDKLEEQVEIIRKRKKQDWNDYSREAMTELQRKLFKGEDRPGDFGTWGVTGL